MQLLPQNMHYPGAIITLYGYGMSHYRSLGRTRDYLRESNFTVTLASHPIAWQVNIIPVKCLQVHTLLKLLPIQI